jgi:diguanylate cyclase (GGDEF)-like protein/PAS domain S-box-containing protein
MAMGNEVFGTTKEIIDGLHDAAVVIDEQFNVVHANPNLYRTMGWSRKRCAKAIEAGLNHFDWMHAGETSEREWAQKCFTNGRPLTQAEVHLTLKGDVEGLFQLNYVPLKNENDSIVGLALVYRDVSDEAKLQKEYRVLLDKEKERADELERLVEERTRQLKDALKEVVQLSRTDALTGLLNRRAFEEAVAPMMSLSERHFRHGAILLCDLDHFKAVNDTFGHQAGDVVLVETAKALKNSVRKEDVVCRYGGEEFVIFLSEIQRENVMITANRCLNAIKNIPVQDLVKGKKDQQTMSMGVALFPEHGSHLSDLIGLADQALYVSKESGRDRFNISEGSASSQK